MRTHRDSRARAPIPLGGAARPWPGRGWRKTTSRAGGALLALLLLGAPEGARPLRAQATPRAVRDAGASPSSPVSPRFDSLDAQVEALMREWSVPGLSLAVVVNGETRVLKGYGLRELARPEPVDEHTVFALASTTKAFTAAALGILVDEGRLSWDDPVATRLPPRFRLGDSAIARTLTIRDILSHRSGYDRHEALWHAFGYTRGEVVERLGRLRPSWGLRERFGYQNLMYSLAGQIVESVSGSSWDRFVEERILRPLRMSRSATGAQGLSALGNVATPHARGRDGVVSVVPRRDADNIGPSGSMISSAADMAEWLRFNLASGVAGGRRILSEGVVRAMQAPQVRIRPEDDIVVGLMSPGGEGVSYGMGWYVHEYFGHTVVEHPGGVEGMSPIVVLVPDMRAGIVILTNISMPTAVQFALRGEILDALLGIQGLDWPAQTRAALQRLSGGFAPARGTPGAAPAPPTLPLPSYAGSYAHEAYGNIQVMSGERGLAVRFGQRGTVSPLIHLGGDEFLMVWQSPLFPPERCRFELDQAGRIRSAVFTGPAGFTGMGTFQRREEGR